MTAKIAYIIVAHQDPHLVARLARLLIANDGLVVIHFDLNAPPEEFSKLRAELGNFVDQVLWPQRERVQWGEWSIVQATLNSLAAIAASERVPDFVHLMSGSDYPIRPLSEFRDYLEKNKGTEFIECVNMSTGNWVKGGLTHERYQYRHWFNWKSDPITFDRSWKWQRKVGLKRSFPVTLRPHLGSQWWTLSWEAIQAVLSAGNDQRLRAFFQTVWIPDEMFIQSIIGSSNDAPATSPILTLYQFSETGVPVVYYNDHAEYLARQPFFFARKISRYADRLRDELDKFASGARKASFFPHRLFGVRTREYSRHVARWEKPQPGVRLLGYQKDDWRGDLVYQDRPIVAVFGASHEELLGLAKILNQTGHFLCHGALFHPEQVEFIGGAPRYAGYGREDMVLRDDSRPNFLSDVAKETPRELIVGFLAPWTMDKHIRERMVWSSFSRNVIVRGNILRAFKEHVEREQNLVGREQNLLGDDDGVAAEKPGRVYAGDRTTEAALASPQELEKFRSFEKEYSAYYAEILTAFNSSGAAFCEIDLLDDDWSKGLATFLKRDTSAAPKLPATYPVPFVGNALCPHATTGVQASPDFSAARKFIDLIPEERWRRAHLRDLARGAFRGAPGPKIAICGASQEELAFVAEILEYEDIAVLRPRLGIRSKDAAPLNVPLSGADEDECLSLVLPWTEYDHTNQRLLFWCENVKVIVVRGNILRAFENYRDGFEEVGRDGFAAKKPVGNRIAPNSVGAFLGQYKKYHEELRNDCDYAKAEFIEIDLMSATWCPNLLRFVGSSAMRDEDERRSFILERASHMSIPGKGSWYARQLINSIAEVERREAHIFA